MCSVFTAPALYFDFDLSNTLEMAPTIQNLVAVV
jgi:hypothetical protein